MEASDAGPDVLGMFVTLRSAVAAGSAAAALLAGLVVTAGTASGAAAAGAALGPAQQLTKASGSTTYAVALPVPSPGSYRLRVTLDGAYYTSSGKPLFQVLVEAADVSTSGTTVSATAVEFPVEVHDGQLDAVLSGMPDHVEVKDVAVLARAAGAASSAPATFLPGTAVPPVGASLPAPTCTRTYEIPGLVSSTTSGDNTAAFNTAIAGARAGDCLTVPAGVYRRSGNIDVPSTKSGITILGAGRGKSIIYGTSLDKHGFRILGADDVRVQGLTLDTVTGGTRTGQNQQGHATLLLNPGTEGFLGQDLHLRNARAAAFFAYGASTYHLHRVEAESSLADGFHNTNGSHSGTFTDCVSTNTGDDGWAMVAYGGPAATVPHDFTVTRFTVNGNTWGRGFGIVNSHGLTVHGPTVIRDTAAAGVLIARETQYGGEMHPVRNIRFLGETRLERANYNRADHGAVLINNPEASQPVEGVHVEAVTAVDTGKNRHAFPSHNVYVKGTGRISADLRDFRFRGVGPKSLLGGARTSDSIVTLTGWSPSDGYGTD